MAIEGTRRFFFYGTLIAGGPPPVRRALARLRRLGPVHTTGLLYAIEDPEGWYPAMIEGPGKVVGQLYQASEEFGAADLAALDAYEDCDPDDFAHSLYRRVTTVVAGGPVELYHFNQPLPKHARPIPDGHFIAWIEQEGFRPFG